jgi:hypothetical protein
MLEPGVEYAWRVKAKTIEGLNLFQNNGYSEVFIFMYGNVCPVPTNIEANVQTGEKVTISWIADPMNNSFQVRYRLKDQKDAVWHTAQSLSNQVELGQILTAEKKYEYQVQGICNENLSDYSTLATFYIPRRPETPFKCGQTESTKAIVQLPKISLEPDEYIYSNNFPIKILEVTGSDGVFSGKGLMKIPFLSGVWINVKFENIYVNVNNQVYKGEIISTAGKNQ